MKNKNPNESIFKKKGFYVALYSCLGAVMVLAAVVSFGNMSSTNNQTTQKDTTEKVDFSQMETTSNNDDSSYLAPDDKENTITEDQNNEESSQAGSGFGLKAKPGTTETPTVTAAPTKQPETKAGVSPSPSASITPKTGATAPTASPASTEKAVENSQPPATITSSPPPTDKAKEQAESDAVDVTEADPVFNTFDDGEKMSWPILGEVVMDYSDDHAVYDETLDQYRTNDSISISADIGAQVVASADGKVLTVEKDKENGNTVVIDHGNGWTTTYSQLQDGVLVEEGDVVKQGQVIGGVSSPSIYSVLLGNHVDFKVAKNDETIDPATVLE